MQAQGNALVPSRDGILFVSGFGTSLRVDRGHLTIRSGSGRDITEARLSRVSRPRLRRLVVFGKGGFVTFEALAWLHAIGCSFANLSRDGELVACSGNIPGRQTTLRRAQALAAGTNTGQELTRLVLGAKLEGHRRTVEDEFNNEHVSDAIARSIAHLDSAQNAHEAMTLEAQAAAAYWSAWEREPMHFARADITKIPDHWTRVGGRRSALTITSPRLATSPAQALINYIYALGEFACSVALRAHGLDPDIGWLHRDAPYRASAALDVEEAVRPVADAFVLDLLRSRTFSRREFGELASGQVRLSSSLAKPLAETTLPMLEASAQPVVADVVAILSGSVGSSPRIRSRKAPVKRGAVQVRPMRESKRVRVHSACRICGLILQHPHRQVCDECLSEVDRERTDRLSRAGKATLAAMRASAQDPAHSAAARRQRAETSRATSSAMRAWERDHRRPDPEIYEREILPRIQEMTVPQLMKITGLSQFHCWKVRKGERRLHARHWDAISEQGRTSSAS